MYSILVLEVLVDNLLYVVVVGLGKREFSQLLEEDARRGGQHALTLRALENICLSLVSYTSSISQTALISPSVGSAMAAVRCPVCTGGLDLGCHRLLAGKIVG